MNPGMAIDTDDRSEVERITLCQKCRLRLRSSELGKQPGFSVVYLHFQGALVTVTCALSACTR